MDYENARIYLARQVRFRNSLKANIVNYQSAYNYAFEYDKTNTPGLKLSMRNWKDESSHFDAENKKEIQQIFRVRLNRMSNCQWRIKYFDTMRKLYAHIHNFNIDNAVLYFEKLKELSHEGMDINERLCDVDPNYGVEIIDNETGSKTDSDKQHAYKQFCDNMMGTIKQVEENLGRCKEFIIAKEVVQAKKNMITRKKKRKH